MASAGAVDSALTQPGKPGMSAPNEINVETESTVPVFARLRSAIAGTGRLRGTEITPSTEQGRRFVARAAAPLKDGYQPVPAYIGILG